MSHQSLRIWALVLWLLKLLLFPFITLFHSTFSVSISFTIYLRYLNLCTCPLYYLWISILHTVSSSSLHTKIFFFCYNHSQPSPPTNYKNSIIILRSLYSQPLAQNHPETPTSPAAAKPFLIICIPILQKYHSRPSQNTNHKVIDNCSNIPNPWLKPAIIDCVVLKINPKFISPLQKGLSFIHLHKLFFLHNTPNLYFFSNIFKAYLYYLIILQSWISTTLWDHQCYWRGFFICTKLESSDHNIR